MDAGMDAGRDRGSDGGTDAGHPPERCVIPLDCAVRHCVDYAPFDRSRCNGGLSEYFREGTCGLAGEVRYRIEANGGGNQFTFWDESTGHVLAYDIGSDIGEFCGNRFDREIIGDVRVVDHCQATRSLEALLCATEDAGAD
jgi:hypothetical protein